MATRPYWAAGLLIVLCLVLPGARADAHEQTYRHFVTLVKTVIVVVAAILILMAIFLT